MTDTIKNHYELLEKKISRRTDELVSKTVTLEDKNRQLNSINKEQSITNRKLKKSETELKNALATRDKFFSIISHDLKNSFFSLLSMSEILIKNLENSHVNSDIKEYSHYIYYSSQQLFLVVDNLLNWANSEQGTIKFRPQLLKIKPIIENIISFLKLNADEKNIQISSQVDEEFSVYADLNMVNTIFRNLVSNAIKFSEIDGKINIVTREEGRKIIVSIQDQGVGIRDEDINKLFKLEKHSEIGSSPEKGTGLGLTLVKEFVEKNGGQIHAESEYGKGTTFTFSLLKKKS
jgi:signal transduction histidine kinase